LRFFHRLKRFAPCFADLILKRPSISQALASRTLGNQFGAFNVAKAGTVRVAE
jgi:hypothetical protein